MGETLEDAKATIRTVVLDALISGHASVEDQRDAVLGAISDPSVAWAFAMVAIDAQRGAEGDGDE